MKKDFDIEKGWNVIVVCYDEKLVLWFKVIFVENFFYYFLIVLRVGLLVFEDMFKEQWLIFIMKVVDKVKNY